MLQRVRIRVAKQIVAVAIDLPKGSLPTTSYTPTCPPGIYAFTGNATGLGINDCLLVMEPITMAETKDNQPIWVVDEHGNSDSHIPPDRQFLFELQQAEYAKIGEQTTDEGSSFHPVHGFM